MKGTLYTFNRPTHDDSHLKRVKVVRLTSHDTHRQSIDWVYWPDQYIERHPELRLIGIEEIEVVDDRKAND